MLSVFPVIGAADVAASRDFYVGLLDAAVVFDGGWYAQLQSPANPAVQLGVVERHHSTIPDGHRQPPQGVLISVEVDDVDAVHARALALDLPIVQPLRSEDFGQRHFMTVDPDGLLVDVITTIPFAPEFAAAYGITASAK